MHPEVLIIGGGVIGLSIARALNKQGVKRITLLEQGKCGREASWAAAGMLSPQVEAVEPNAFFDLCCASRDLYPSFADELLDETGIDVELDRTGTLFLAFDAAEAPEIRDRFEWQSKMDLSVDELTVGEARSLEPSISDNVQSALYFPNDWQVENRKLVTALKRYAEQNEINIIEDTRVERLGIDAGRVSVAETNAGNFKADVTVIATGAWTSLIKIGTAEMHVAIEPVRGQIIEFRLSEGLLRHVVCTKRGYLVPRLDARILVGSTSEIVGFDKSTTLSAETALVEMARDVIPNLKDRSIADRWAGLRPRALDGWPVLGQIPGLDNVLVATGHYRNGILLAPLTAKITAGKLTKNIESDYLSIFGADRFLLRGIGMGC